MTILALFEKSGWPRSHRCDKISEQQVGKLNPLEPRLGGAKSSEYGKVDLMDENMFFCWRNDGGFLLAAWRVAGE